MVYTLTTCHISNTTRFIKEALGREKNFTRQSTLFHLCTSSPEPKTSLTFWRAELCTCYKWYGGPRIAYWQQYGNQSLRLIQQIRRGVAPKLGLGKVGYPQSLPISRKDKETISRRPLAQETTVLKYFHFFKIKQTKKL